MKSGFLCNIENIPEENTIFKEKNFIVVKKTMAAGKPFPVHWHDYFEFEIILSGEGRHIYNNNVYTLSPGCAYLLCYSDFHSVEPLCDLELINVRFNEAILDPALLSAIRLGGKFNCIFDKGESEAIIETISLLSKEALSNMPFSNLISSSLINRIVVEMVRKCGANTTEVSKTPVQRAIYYIYENFREELTLSSLAKELSISQNHLGMLIKRETGLSFNEYLNSVRLKYACDLLKTTELSVKEVAFSSGYGSVEYFLFIFKQKLKTTPSKYRNL